MSYTVKELFVTLQGEGARAGTKALFIRFAGCNLWNGRAEDRGKGKGACARWCDTDFFKGEKLSAHEIARRAEELWPASERGPRWIVLTGGEPTLQVDDLLVRRLHSDGWRLAMESNGSRPAPAAIDWLTLSPKLGAELVQRSAHELKVVLPGGDPGWTDEQLIELEQLAPELFVQAQDPIAPTLIGATHLKRGTLGCAPDYQANVERCVKFIMRRPRWRLSYQVHKAVNLP